MPDCCGRIGHGPDYGGLGAEDVFLAFRFSGDHRSSLPLRWHGQLGYLRAGSSDLIGPAQERDLWYGGLTLDWIVADALDVRMQLQLHKLLWGDEAGR